MSLQTRLSDLITAVGTDYKNFKTWMFGSTSGSLADLSTTDKSSFVGAINELKASSGTPADASTTVKGVVELADNSETITGTDAVRAVTPAGLTAKIDTDTALTGNADTRIASQKATKAYVDGAISGVTIVDASTTVKGKVELATDAETLTGTDTARAMTPSNLTAKMDTDNTLAGNSTTRIPAQSAVKSYVDTAIAGVTIADASTTVKGKVELATDVEATTGTDTVRAVTPANVAAVFTDRIDTNVALGSSNTKVPSQLAAKTYIDALIDAANALQYKGVIDASTNPNYPAASAGHMYLISVAGKIGGASGPNVEVGDMIICKTDGTASGTEASVGAQWAIIQKNIDGAVTGPASSTAGNLATFSGTTGKVIQDASVAISTDGTLATNNNTKVPTEGAIRTYLAANFYTKTELGNPETDLAAAYAAAKA